MNALDSINSRKSLGVLCLMMVISLGTLQIQPVLTGALLDQAGMPLNNVGWIFAAELISMATACGVSALLINRVNRRRFVLIALLMLTYGNLVSTQLHSENWLLTFRAICGASGGIVIAVVCATAALRSLKDETFAMINISSLLWNMLLVTCIPLLLLVLDVQSAFYLLATTSLFAAMGCNRIPEYNPNTEQNARCSVRMFELTSMLLVVLFVLQFFGHSNLWVYQVQIGRSLNLECQQIGYVLCGGILSGALGACLPGCIARSFGLLFWHLLSFGTALLATVFLIYGNSLVAFVTTACLIHMVWFFSLSYLLSMAAKLDLSGRLPGLCIAAMFVGQALGPFGAAMLVSRGHFCAVVWLAGSAYVVALIISCVVLNRMGLRLML
ncbi:MFS transporter [Pseudomonas asplenii]|uniref:MFS transporter n=1 Tax=Pseudomonas asplenii TaxID=53407 RepID=UPI0037CA4969